MHIRRSLTWVATLAVVAGSSAFAGPRGAKARPVTAKPADTADAGTRTRVVPNVGACKVDADCELVRYAPSCCDRACGPTAVGKQEAERNRQPKDCPDERAGRCPPPSPCFPEQLVPPLGAVCQAGTCSTVYPVM